jgi:DNA-binding NtrC family response regulator
MTTSTAPVYIVDDEVSVREALSSLIRSAGWRVETFGSAREFLTSEWASVPSCLVLDVELPDLSGFELQEELARNNPKSSIIFLTGRGDIPMSVRAIKAGAVEFLTKPPAEDQLLEAIRQAMTDAPPPAKRASPGQPAPEGRHKIVGKSAALKTMLAQLHAVAPTASTVLILGETGTGKESVARTIHDRSQRHAGPFISVNCAAIPQSLAASELFGHERGAFTGALQRRLGRFEQAQGGTIFLDEVGELPPDIQVALLRVLQERQFERVGGQQALASDVRVVAATNRDLPAAIAAGTFRSDLFYRLNVFPIEMPPLRSRREDIALLVEHFLDLHEGASGLRRELSPRTQELLASYAWPGNIRELQNVVERALIISKPGELAFDERWFATQGLLPTAASPLSESLARQERSVIEAALAETGGKVSGPAGAAALLKMPPSTMDSKIKSLRIEKHRFRRLSH